MPFPLVAPTSTQRVSRTALTLTRDKAWGPSLVTISLHPRTSSSSSPNGSCQRHLSTRIYSRAKETCGSLTTPLLYAPVSLRFTNLLMRLPPHSPDAEPRNNKCDKAAVRELERRTGNKSLSLPQLPPSQHARKRSRDSRMERRDLRKETGG